MFWKIAGVICVVAGTICCYVGGITQTSIVALVGGVVALGVIIKAIFFPSDDE